MFRSIKNTWTAYKAERRNRRADRKLKELDERRREALEREINVLKNRQWLNKVVMLTCDHIGHECSNNYKRNAYKLKKLYHMRNVEENSQLRDYDTLQINR